MADAVEELRTVTEALAKHGETVTETAQRLQAVVEPDDPVVARVGSDLALLLHVQPGGPDRKREAECHLEDEAAPRARVDAVAAAPVAVIPLATPVLRKVACAGWGGVDSM